MTRVVRGILAPAAALALCGGCLAPPALLEAHHVELQEALKSYPPGTESVAIQVEPEVTLRGVFVPSQDDAPIVLHLLESSGSAGSVSCHFGMVTRELADLGYASLIVDYTGVGLSDGDRSVAHLERDGQAMWGEALRRAGGDAGRVHIRATSLGTVTCALLLDRGLRPASMVWIAPVFPDTVTSRFAHTFYGPLEGWAAAVFFRDVADVDVLDVLKKAQVTGLVLASDADPLLTTHERVALDRALEPAAHLVPRSGGHVQLSFDAHALLLEELQVFVPRTSPRCVKARADAVIAGLDEAAAREFAPASDERSRLERLCAIHSGQPAQAVAAAALSIPRAPIAARLLWLLARRPYRDLDFAEQRAVLSLDDPAGELPIDWIERTSAPGDFVEQFGGVRGTLDAVCIAAAARDGGANADDADWRATLSLNGVPSITLGLDGRALFQALVDRGLTIEDAERQFIRVLLKSQRIPDRLVRDGEGRPVIEVKSKGAWTVLDRNPDGLAVRSYELRNSRFLKN